MKKILLLITLSLTLKSFAQDLQSIRTYYDPWAKTQLHEVYTVIAGTSTKQGLYKEYAQNGILAKEVTYTNGVANGSYKEYYTTPDLSGKLALLDNYKNGKLDGLSEEYAYPNGKKTATKTLVYVKGDLLKETHYYEGGQKGTERDYKTRNYLEWYENGQKKEAGSYDSYGYKTGSYTKWYDDGQLQEQKKDSSGVILAMQYHERGGKTYAVALTPAGKYISTTLDSSGRKVEEAESKPSGGTPPFYYDGTYTAYYSTGEVLQTGEYSGGRKTGVWKSFDKEGKELQDASSSTNQQVQSNASGSDLDEIKRLLKEKEDKLTPKEKSWAERVISEQTVRSYDRVLEMLRTK